MLDKVCNILSYTQGLPIDKIRPNVSTVLDKWKENKQWFIDVFGGTTVEHPLKLTFDLDEKAKEKKFYKFLSSVEDSCGYATSLSDFLNQISYEEFYNNKIKEAIKTFNYKGDSIIIPEGSKVVKAFKHFFENTITLQYWQDRASTVIQENVLTGTLCLSVDPVDYLTISENGYNWRSCHALDGDFRAGNIQYMMDKSTVIAYVKGDEDFELGGVKCSNKKWRVLLFVDDMHEVVFASKQYPFSCQGVMDEILNIFYPFLFGNVKRYWCAGWENNIIENALGEDLADRYYRINNRLFGIEDMVYNNTDYAHRICYFNDLLDSSDYLAPYIAYNKYREIFRVPPSFNIGCEPVPCLLCGKLLDQSGEVFCHECEENNDTENLNFYYCEDCGRRIPIGTIPPVYDENNNIHWYCKDCFKEEAVLCSICGTWNTFNAMSVDNPNRCKMCENN